MHHTVRTAPRFAARALAWAAVPVLLVAGCTGSPGSSGESASEDQQPPTRSPSPEPVRFSALPEPCSTIDEGTIEQVVPEADPKRGDALSSSDASASGACLWSGLNDYQFRSLTVSLRRFDSDVTIGSGDERAEGYMAQLVQEITDDDANTKVDEGRLSEPGEGGAISISYSVTKTSEDDGEQTYRQQRVIARTGNVVVTVDYSGAGLEDADNPSVERIKENAEAATVAAVAAVDASAEAEQDGEQGDQGDQEQSDSGDA